MLQHPYGKLSTSGFPAPVASTKRNTLSCTMQVMRLALSDAGMTPSDMAALEMHGTGTPLGDPIEVPHSCKTH